MSAPPAQAEVIPPNSSIALMNFQLYTPGALGGYQA